MCGVLATGKHSHANICDKCYHNVDSTLCDVVQLHGAGVSNTTIFFQCCTTLYNVVQCYSTNIYTLPYQLHRFLPSKRSAAMLNMLLRLAEYAFIVSTTLNYSERDLHTLDVKVEKLLHSMKKTLRLKTEPFKWTFVKFHMTTHVTWWIKRFGHCGQTDAATLERLHKIVRYVFSSLSVTSLIHVPQRCIT